MEERQSTIHVVDDDEHVRNALAFLITSVDWRVKTYASAQTFIDDYEPSKPECLLLDVRMPGLGGLELQSVLTEHSIHLPIIIVTGHADVPMTVRAMRAGAVDVVEKPFNDRTLLDRIKECLRRDVAASVAAQERREASALLRRLTHREHEVMELLVAGMRTKAVASELGISIRTAERHRARVMEKLQASSLSDVVKLSLQGQAREQ